MLFIYLCVCVKLMEYYNEYNNTERNRLHRKSRLKR